MYEPFVDPHHQKWYSQWTVLIKTVGKQHMKNISSYELFGLLKHTAKSVDRSIPMNGDPRIENRTKHRKVQKYTVENMVECRNNTKYKHQL